MKPGGGKNCQVFGDFFTNKRLAWEEHQKCVLSEVLVREAWK